MGKLDDKYCIITGADCEIGQAVAELFAAEGAKLLLAGKENDVLDIIIQKIKSCSETAEFFSDGFSNDKVGDLFSFSDLRFGSPHILINIVPNSTQRRPVDPNLDQKDEEPFKILENCLLYCKHAIQRMANSGGGSIVNIAYAERLWGITRDINNSATAGAIFSSTTAMALEYAPYDIRVNALALGIIKTEEYRSTREKSESGFEKKLIRHIPMGRLGKPIEVATAALFLSLDDSSYITGAVLPVDGGYRIF